MKPIEIKKVKGQGRERYKDHTLNAPYIKFMTKG